METGHPYLAARCLVHAFRNFLRGMETVLEAVQVLKLVSLPKLP